MRLAVSLIVVCAAYGEAGTAWPREPKIDPIVYNSKVKTDFRAGGQLVCEDNKAEEESLIVDGDVFPEFFEKKDGWGSRLDKVELRQLPSPTGSGYIVSRSLIFSVSSSALQSTLTSGVNSHGCRSELFPTGSSFTVLADGKVKFTSSMFGAARICYKNPFSGNTHSICGTTVRSTSSTVFQFSQPAVSEKQCANGTFDRDSMFQVEEVPNSRTSTRDVDEGCESLGGILTLAGLPEVGTVLVVAALLGSSGSTGSSTFQKLIRNSFGRPDKDDYYFCPQGVGVQQLNPKAISVRMNEGIDRMPGKAACRLFRRAKRELLVGAERAAPTQAVEVQRGDSLWVIAGRLWGDGRLMTLLGKPADGLQPGQILVVPPIDRHLQDKSFILEGDTTWGLSRRLNGDTGHIGSIYRRINPKPPSASKIFPFAKVEGEVK